MNNKKGNKSETALINVYRQLDKPSKKAVWYFMFKAANLTTALSKKDIQGGSNDNQPPPE